MSSGISDSSSRGPDSESMRYLIGGADDAGPKLVGEKNKTHSMKAAAPDKHKDRTLATEPVVGAVKAAKKKAAKSVRLGNVQKMLTVSLKKRPELILKDGEFPQIIQQGTQEIIGAIHKATGAVLMRQYVDQFTRSEKLLSELNTKLIGLLNQTPEKNKKRREEIAKLSSVIESVLRQFHAERAFVEKVKAGLEDQLHTTREVSVQNEAQVEPKRQSVAMPAVVVGMMASYLEEEEGGRTLDDLLQLFTEGTGKEAALLEMQKKEKTTQKVNDAILKAMQKEGPFTFPEELSEADLSAVTHLSLNVLGLLLTAEAFREIIARLPHLTELTLEMIDVTAEAAGMFSQLTRLRSLTVTRYAIQAPLPAEVLHKIIVSVPHLSSLDLTGQGVTAENMALIVQLKELRHLNLSNINPRVSVETLREIVTHLPHLTSLHLPSTEITKAMVDLLSQLQELHTLNLSDATMDDERLQQLAKCKQLRILRLEENMNITTVQPLAACLKLEKLDLGCCLNLISLQGLSACKELLSVSLQYCQKIKDLEPLSLCPKLRKLTLAGCNKLATIQPLEACTKLEELKIYNATALTSLQALSACTGLVHLALNNCKNVTDLKPLAACTKLKELNLSGCTALTSLLPLLTCSQLQKIVLPSTWNADMQAEKEVLQKALPHLQFVDRL